MGIREYEQSLETPLRQATVMLLMRDDEVLLAMKKRGFGVGKWNGVGGKQDPGEDIVDTAIRESQVNWGQQVHIFIATKWQGEPVETEEMRPQWFKIKDIPFKEMWVDDEVWMPKAFAGALLKGSFMFNGEKMEEYYLNEVKSFE